MTNRVGRVERTTRESSVLVEIDLDGSGKVEVATGVVKAPAVPRAPSAPLDAAERTPPIAPVAANCVLPSRRQAPVRMSSLVMRSISTGATPRSTSSLSAAV